MLESMARQDIFALSTSANRRVMVVDDSLTVRKVVCKIVDGVGIETYECASAREGLDRLGECFYDLIFLDYLLPDATASEFLDELLKNTNYAHVPIVLMSSKGAEISRISEFKENVCMTLTKPFAADKVQQVLIKAFGLKADRSGFSEGAMKESNPVTMGNRSQTRVLLERGLRRVAKHIPALEANRAGASARGYYLPFLLNPEFVASMEKFEDDLRHAAKTETYSDLSGRLDGHGAYLVLRTLSERRRTGRLDLAIKNRSMQIFLHKGSVVGVATRSSKSYFAAMNEGLRESLEPHCGQLIMDQEDTACPLLVSVDEDHLKGVSRTEALLETSETFLSSFLVERCNYRFWSDDLAPTWAMEHSINTDVAAFFLSALRRIRGWGVISGELGDLVTRFGHRFANDVKWCRPHLTSFESVVFDFLKFDYSVSELSSTLGENPSRVAEAIHTLHKFGLVVESAQLGKETVREQMDESAHILLISSDATLCEAIALHVKGKPIQLTVCSTGKEAMLKGSASRPAVVIDDGTCEDGSRFRSSVKLLSMAPETVCVAAESASSDLQPAEIVQLRAFALLSQPFHPAAVAATLDSAISEHHMRSVDVEQPINELDSVNERFAARERRIDTIERELQQREHELLRNEEVFFEKCNRFEEERVRLEILQDEFSN